LNATYFGCFSTWLGQQDLNINDVVDKLRVQVNASFNSTRLVIAQLRQARRAGYCRGVGFQTGR